MSLLGNNVFANPTTPLWGGGGGGGGSNFQTLNILQGGNLNIGSSVNLGTSLNFYKDVSGTLQSSLDMFYSPTGGVDSNLRLTLTDQTGGADMLQVGDLRAFGQGADPENSAAISLGNQGTADLGLRLIDGNSGTTTSTFATFASNAMDLSNVSSINGVPYFNAPGTNFSFSNYPGGTPLAEAPDYTVLNAFTFTAPANGKVYMESLGNFVSTVKGGGGNMTFAVNGTELSNAVNQFNAYDSNVNLFGMSMYQIPVSGGTVYDISSIAQCSALPPAGSDLVCTTSRMFIMFSPQ